MDDAIILLLSLSIYHWNTLNLIRKTAHLNRKYLSLMIENVTDLYFDLGAFREVCDWFGSGIAGLEKLLHITNNNVIF